MTIGRLRIPRNGESAIWTVGAGTCDFHVAICNAETSRNGRKGIQRRFRGFMTVMVGGEDGS